MSVFNTKGVEFKNAVLIKEDPHTDPTYSFKFPAVVGTRVVERWARKVRPIKDLTQMLRGCNLRRYTDYMVEHNDVKVGYYTYWFLDAKHALMFQMMSSTLTQSHQQPGQSFNIVCPHCQSDFPTAQVSWR